MTKEVIIPAAGLGKRMNKVTKGNISKLMMTLKDKPLISYAIEEALNSGYKKIYVILNEIHKNLYNFLKTNYPMTNLIMQKDSKGVAESILQAESFITQEFFALILPDIVIKSEEPALLQMEKTFQDKKANILGLLHLSSEEKEYFGVCEFSKKLLKKIGKNIFEIKKIFPKEYSDGDLYHARSILHRSFFNITKELISKDIEPDDSNVYKEMMKKQKYIGLQINGNGFDTGNQKGYKRAINLL